MTGGLGFGDAIGEPGIAEAQVVLEAVVTGMVDALLFILAGVAQVERCDTQMLQKGREVRARAERLERQVRTAGCASGAGLGAAVAARIAALEGVHAQLRPQTLQHAAVGLRVRDFGGHLVDESLQRMTAAGMEKTARILVGIHIEQRVGLQLLRMGRDPFGRAEQAWLLAVPAGVDQRATRSPAALDQCADGLGFGHHGDVAG